LDAHEIMLLEQFAGKRLIAQLRDTEVDPDFSGKATVTSKVHHIRELNVTTDIVLDAVTIVPDPELSDRVRMLSGTIQWFDRLVKIGEEMVSPPLSGYTFAGFTGGAGSEPCVPLVTDSEDSECDVVHRWNLLYLRINYATDLPELLWVIGTPGALYPPVPPQGIPLALVKQEPGYPVCIEAKHIVNFRTVRSTYAPAAQYILPPVQVEDQLYLHDNVQNGTTAFVMETGQWWWYKDGIWAPHASMEFDNTFYRIDLTDTVTRITLPWPVRNYAEVLVIRDGQIMSPNDDYTLTPGPNSFITFTYPLYPNMRLLFIRNPFLGVAYSPLAENNIPQVHHLYVNGSTGHDAYPGTAAQPFKTLQAAFDTLPLQSKHAFHLHVAQLDIADVITSNRHGQRVYGVCENISVRYLRIDVENDCDWDDAQLDYLYLLDAVGMVTQVDAAYPVYYPIRLNHCTSYFTNTSIIAKRAVIAGGTSGWLSMEVAYDAAAMFMAGAIIYTEQSNYHQLAFQAGAVVEAVNCDFQGLQGVSGGYMVARACRFHSLLSLRSTFMDLVQCSLKGTGLFTASRVYVDTCTNTGPAGSVLCFFTITDCSVLEIVNSTVENNQETPIIVSNNSVVRIRGGKITANQGHGILLQDNSIIYAENAEISKNQQNGVALRRGCFGEFSGVTGTQNAFYGIHCEKYSSARRLNSTSLTGFLGPYFEEIPGGTTVAADSGDLHPSTLINKLKVGTGLQMDVVPSFPPAENYRVEIRANISELNQLVSSYATAATIYEYEATMVNGQVLDFEIVSPGMTFLTAVHHRLNAPIPRTRRIDIQAATQHMFIYMDSLAGTQIVSGTGLTLKNRPGLGYPTLSAYWVMTKTGTHASLATYAASLLSGSKIIGSVPSGTNIRVAVSVTQGATFMRWTGSMWEVLPGGGTLSKMQYADDVTTFNLYPPAAWEALRAMGKPTVDLCFTLQSTSSVLTPIVEAVEWEYTEYGAVVDITQQFKRHFFTTRAVFENTGPDVNPPIYFTLVPVSLGTPGVVAGGVSVT